MAGKESTVTEEPCNPWGHSVTKWYDGKTFGNKENTSRTVGLVGIMVKKDNYKVINSIMDQIIMV